MLRKAVFVTVWIIVGTLVSALAVTAQGPKPQRASTALGTSFTYQGQLKKNGAPLNGSCSLSFKLYADIGGTSLVAGPVTGSPNPVTVSGGVFAVQVDFGPNAFTGDARWLQTSVQCPGDASATVFALQALTPAPMALSLPGLWTKPNATSPNLIGGYSGNVISDTLAGGTIGGGGANGYPNQVWAQYATVAGGLNNIASGQDAAIGGGFANSAGGLQAVIGGGARNSASAQNAAVGGGLWNSASADHAFLGGGSYNTAGGVNATVAGGASNTAGGSGAFVGGGGYDGTYTAGNQALAVASTIAGGLGNSVSISATEATIAGGSFNTASGASSAIGGGFANAVSAWSGVIGGGLGNTIAVTGGASTISGGAFNAVSGSHAIIGGGNNNVASGDGSVIGGGTGNVASGSGGVIGGGLNNIASSTDAVVTGGYSNTASADFSLAAGRKAWARYAGSFVWNDSVDSGTPFADSQANEFNVRASGGVRLFSSDDYSTSCILAAGSGSWNCTSDRNTKANFASVDTREVLAQLASIPVETWNFKTQDTSIRHIGPMAQDFHAAFGVGEDDTTISTVDAQGVALAAIQGLYQIVQEQQAEIAQLKAQANTASQAPQTNQASLQMGSLLPALVGLSLLLNVFLGAVLIAHLHQGGRA